MAAHLAVACDVYDGVFFVLSFFPRGVLDEILNLIESVSEGGFPSYSCPPPPPGIFFPTPEDFPKINRTKNQKHSASDAPALGFPYVYTIYGY